MPRLLRKNAVLWLSAARYCTTGRITLGDISTPSNECVIHILNYRFKQVKNCCTCPGGDGAAKCHTRVIFTAMPAALSALSFVTQVIILERRKNDFIAGTVPVFGLSEDFVS